MDNAMKARAIRLSPSLAGRLATISAVGGVLSLMAVAPALAVEPPFFTLTFESTATSSSNAGINGIKGEATYSFSSATPGLMTLSLKNLSGSPATQAFLVSTGFNFPTAPPATANISLTSFAGLNGWSIVEGDSLDPFGTFDICAEGSAGTGCDASASPNTGLGIGSLKTSVATFNFTSDPDFLEACEGPGQALCTATKYRDAFVAMYQAPTGSAGTFDGNYFMRFKGITGTNGGSDKIWATSITTGGGGGGQIPGDSVPGPLPLFGAAAAFGYSRKLRRRVKVQSVAN